MRDSEDQDEEFQLKHLLGELEGGERVWEWKGVRSRGERGPTMKKPGEAGSWGPGYWRVQGTHDGKTLGYPHPQSLPLDTWPASTWPLAGAAALGQA